MAPAPTIGKGNIEVATRTTKLLAALEQALCEAYGIEPEPIDIYVRDCAKCGRPFGYCDEDGDPQICWKCQGIA